MKNFPSNFKKQIRIFFLILKIMKNFPYTFINIEEFS